MKSGRLTDSLFFAEIKKKTICDKKETVEKVDKATVTIPLNEEAPFPSEPAPSSLPATTSENNTSVEMDNMICPVCCRSFFNIPFQDFQMHVENHFTEDENFEVL